MKGVIGRWASILTGLFDDWAYGAVFGLVFCSRRDGNIDTRSKVLDVQKLNGENGAGPMERDMGQKSDYLSKDHIQMTK